MVKIVLPHSSSWHLFILLLCIFQTHQRDLASTEPLYQQVQSVGTALQPSSDKTSAKQIKKELAELQVTIQCSQNSNNDQHPLNYC